MTALAKVTKSDIAIECQEHVVLEVSEATIAPSLDVITHHAVDIVHMLEDIHRLRQRCRLSQPLCVKCRAG